MYDSLDAERCTNCFTLRRRAPLDNQPPAKEVEPAPKVAPEEEIPLDQSQWRCKACTFINTVESWTDSYAALCEVCNVKDQDIYDQIDAIKKAEFEEKLAQ